MPHSHSHLHPSHRGAAAGDLNFGGVVDPHEHRDRDHHGMHAAPVDNGKATASIGTSDPMDDLERTFDAALQHTRSTFLDMVSAKDQTILDLRTELARRDAHIQEQSLRISSLEHDLASAEKRNADLATVIRKMYSVRQQMDSFVEDEPLVAEILRKPSIANSGGGGGYGDVSEMDHSQQQHASFTYRHHNNMQQQQQAPPSSSRFSTHPMPRSPHSPTSTSVSRAAYRPSRSPSPTGSARGPAPAQRRPISETGRPIATGFESKEHLPSAALRRPPGERNTYHAYPSGGVPHSNATTPMRPKYASGAAAGSSNNPPPATPPANGQPPGTSVDGRDFFRHARRTLSYDEFTSLLTNVKAFNARQQSRQVTLDRVVHMLGGRYPEIERAFVGLMMHGATAPAAAQGRGAGDAVGGRGGAKVRAREVEAKLGPLGVGQEHQAKMLHGPGTVVAGV